MPTNPDGTTPPAPPVLPALVELTAKLKGTPTQRVVEYPTEGGTVIGIGLMNDRYGAVQKVLMSKGAKMPCHQHPLSREWLIVLSGRVKICRIEGGEVKERVLTRGEYAFLNSGEGHGTEALEDTWVLGIAIPPDEGYPRGA